MNLTSRAVFVPFNTSGLLAKVSTGLYNGVSTAAAMVEGEAKRLCPVDTGDLQNSITTEIQRGVSAVRGKSTPLSSGLFTVLAVVAPHVDYSIFVEYGTGRRGAASAGAGPGPYSSTWPGMTARPFMRPSIDSLRGSIPDVVAKAIRDALSSGTPSIRIAAD